MASLELKKAVNSYENYISNRGITEEVINAYADASKVALLQEKDVEYGLKVSARAKEIIDTFTKTTLDGSIDDLQVYASTIDSRSEINLLAQYYNVIFAESPYLVDSFFQWIELDERDPYKRFYFPRKKVLAPVINAYQDIFDGKLDFLSVSQPKRSGKCCIETTLVCTPTGFRQIKDIKVGDLVISANGNATKVIGVYPQEKELDVYEIEFTESGKSKQKTVIECCENHLWEVSTECSRYKRKENRVMSTADLFNGTLKLGHDRHNNYAVDYIKPVEFEEKEVPVNPLLMGALICKSSDKFIPKEYLFNSVEVRTGILQGLCDTDGYVYSGGIEYSTTSKQLADDIQFLVKSLGGKISCVKKKGHYVKDGKRIETQDFYRLHMQFPSEGICPVTSKKHLKKYKSARKKLYHFINDIRKTDRKARMVCIEVEDDSHLYCITENFILTHNTTGGLRLALMMGGRDPDGSIFAVGKGEGLVKRFYGGLLQSFETESIYKRFVRVFPEAIKIGEKDYKSAENLSIDLKSKNIFPTFTCRPIDGAIVGCTEANVLVYIDDCVKNHEEARNRDRLEFLCEKVTDDVLGRRLEGTPIIIQGTKYSLYDPITALQQKADELEWKWREVAIPALDPVTDESNWEIYRKDKKGLRKIFTTEYYRKERKLVSEETWAAEFQQEPFEAKGRMFPENQLNYFDELPVGREPDAIMAACDSADKGEDSCAMVVGYVYGSEVYIVDVVFDNSGTEFTKPECANMLFKYNVKTVTFESNSAGEYFGRDVMELVKLKGGRCSSRYKFNCSNKITRMENARDNIIRDYYFRDFKKMDTKSQYYRFMKELTTMTRSGKVKHDDAPDSLALFENEMRNGVATVEAVRNPYRTGGYGLGYYY